MRHVFVNIILQLFSLALFAKESNETINKLQVQLDQHLDKDTVRVNLLNKLGYQYWIVNPVQSDLLGTQALRLADSLNYPEGTAFANRIIGVSHWARGQYSSALQYLMDGLAIYQRMNDNLGAGTMFNNIGLVYHDQRSYELALKYFNQALLNYETLGNKDKQAGVLSNIGNTYLQMKNYAKTERIYNQVLHLNQALGRKYGIAESFSNLGELNLVRKRLDLALDYFFQSIAIRSTIQDLEGLTMCYYFIGKVYLAEKKYNLAEKYLLQGKNTGIQVTTLKWVTKIYETLKDVEIAQGNYQRAVAYFEEFTVKKDSLFDIEKSRQIAEMQTRFETLQKEQKLQTQQKELALLQQQARFQGLLKNGLLMGILAIVIITYLIISRQHLKIRNNKALMLKNQEVFESQQALAMVELENARLHEIKLIAELESKNKKLTSYSLNFIQKNELIEEVKANLDQLKGTQGWDTSKKLNGLNRLAENNSQIDKDWEDFKRNFEEVHKDFYKVLKDSYPDLTSNELKLCSLLKLNMNLKEAANIMGISPESVKKARHRLRKKFNLTREENLIDHIITIEKQPNAATIKVA